MKKSKEDTLIIQQKLASLCQVCLTKDPTDKKISRGK